MASKKTYSKKNKQAASDKTIDEANKIASGIQKPGQTKEQTKLIAQGIQKGIEQYKKQQKAKARELDKQLKKAKNPTQAIDESHDQQPLTPESPVKWLPWGLLILSWIGFISYMVLSHTASPV